MAASKSGAPKRRPSDREPRPDDDTVKDDPLLDNCRCKCAYLAYIKGSKTIKKNGKGTYNLVNCTEIADKVTITVTA